MLSVTERDAEGSLRGSPGEEGPDASADPKAGEHGPVPQARPVGFQRPQLRSESWLLQARLTGGLPSTSLPSQSLTECHLLGASPAQGAGGAWDSTVGAGRWDLCPPLVTMPRAEVGRP